MSARAAAPSSLSTSFVVQNMDASADANVTATFYDTNGASVNSVNRTVVANKNAIIDQRLSDGGLSGYSSWQGSVVLSSNTQLAAIVNEYSGSNATLGRSLRADSYNGWSSTSAATSIILPQLLWNVYDFQNQSTYTSLIAIQNTSGVQASVTITYYYYTGLQFVHSNILIAANASAFIDMQNESFPGLGSFYGSGAISSNQPVAAVVHHNADGVLTIYPGFTSVNAATTLYVPQVLRRVYDFGNEMWWNTSQLVMSVDGTPATVYATYYHYTGQIYTEIKTANPMITFDQRLSTVFGSNTLYGSAIFTSTKPIVALVNVMTDYHSSRGVQAVSSRAFVANTATAKVYVPFIPKNYLDTGTNLRWNTGAVGELIGDQNSTFTMTYYCSNGSTYTSTQSATPTNRVFTFDTRYDTNLPSVNDLWCSGVITSTGNQIFAVTVNQMSESSALGDSAMNYAGVNANP